MKRKQLILTGGLALAVFIPETSFSQFHPSVRINDDSGEAGQEMACVAVNRFGCAVVCWIDDRDGDWAVYGQIFNPRGVRIMGNFRVVDTAPPPVDADNPSVAMDDRGHFMIVWEDWPDGWQEWSDGPVCDIRGRLFRANGQPLTDPFRINDEGAGQIHVNPSVAMAPNGNFMVSWADSRESATLDVYAQRYDRAGIRIGGNFRVNSDTTSYQSRPDAAMNDNGECIVVWRDFRAGDHGRIFGQRFDAAGTAFGGDFLISPVAEPEENCWDPSVALRNDGRFFVAWSYGAGSSETVLGRAIRSDGTPAAECIKISEGDGVTTQVHPQAAVSHDQGYFCAWQAGLGIGDRIWMRELDADGRPAADPVEISANPGSIHFVKPVIDTDGRGIGIAAWVEALDFKPDIRAAWFGPAMPMNPVAGSGFDGIVPLSWDPIYGETETRTVEIYRSGDPVMNFTKVADLDLSSRPYPKRMLDWIDPKAKNDSTYYYVIGCAGGSRYSEVVSATPSAAGHGLQSAWNLNPVSADGILSPGEWSDATALSIANPAASEPITLYVKNSADTLYIAADDPNDTRVDPANLFGFLFDEDNDALWDPSGMVTEGAIGLAAAGIGYTPYGGDYPESFHQAAIQIPAGVAGAVSTAGGHAQYEMTVSLKTSPLQENSGETIGAAFWIYDPGSVYSGRYRNAGEWPADFLWDAARALGNLTLASETGLAIRSAANPESFRLDQNYPNPFNPSTTIRFKVAKPCRVTLRLYDVTGKEISLIADGRYAAGSHAVLFDSSGLPSGIFLYVIRMGDFTASRKMVVVE